jgi:hypothetical protein
MEAHDRPANTTVSTTRCLDGDWAGSTLDEARRHARESSHHDFRTVTETFSPAGRRIDEAVEVHQL